MASWVSCVHGAKSDRLLLGSIVHFPQGEGIALGIQANGEVAHTGYSRLGLTDCSTEFFNLGRRFTD